MRARVKVDVPTLLDCVSHWTLTNPSNRVVSDQYITPDGVAHELTPDFPRHHEVSRCYLGQYSARYEDKETFFKHLPEIDFGDDAFVADFLDRTGSIRVARADDAGNGENSFQLSAAHPPTEEQVTALGRHCKNVYRPCYLELTYLSDEGVHYVTQDTQKDVGERREPIERTLCRIYGDVLDPRFTRQLSDVAQPSEMRRLRAWMKGRCRV